jgi:hypothetical protein
MSYDSVLDVIVTTLPAQACQSLSIEFLTSEIETSAHLNTNFKLPFEICMYISWFHRKLECDVQNDVLYGKCLSNYIEGDKKELRANTIALEASRFAFSSFIVQESF